MAPPDAASSGNGSGGDGAAAAGAAAPGAGQQQQQQQQQGLQQGQQQAQQSPAGPSAGDGGQASSAQAAVPYRPDGLPDHLSGTSDKETIDKLYKAFDGYRRGEGERGGVPRSPDDYKFEWGETMKPFAENFGKDPLYKETLSIAHKAGISDKAMAKFLPALLGHMVESGMVAPPVNAGEQLMKLTPREAAGLDAAGQKAAAGRRLNNNIAFVDGLKSQLLGSDPQAAQSPLGQALDWLAAETTDKVQANFLVEWLMGRGEQPKPALDGGRKAGGTDDEAIKARIRDPRNDPNSATFDRAFAAETDRLSQQQWG